jgi:hypothetical protein
VQEKSKVPVIIKDDYTVYLELFDNRLWFHTDIKRWTANTKKRYQTDLSCLERLVGCPMFALIREENKKLEKFAKTFGWHRKAEIMCLDGSRAYIYSNKE